MVDVTAINAASIMFDAILVADHPEDLPRNLAVLIPVPGQTYGYGLIEPALDCQDYANYRANQIIDAVDYALHPELKAVDDGVYDPTEPNRAGYTHMVRLMDNVQPIIKETRGIQIGMADFAAAKSEFQQITRATNPFNNPGAGKTATEVVRDTKITGSSIGEIAKHIETDLSFPGEIVVTVVRELRASATAG